MLGDEHLEVRCGVWDPARLDASAGAEVIAPKSSSSSSDSESEEESESSSSDDSGDDSSSDSSDDSTSDSSEDSSSESSDDSSSDSSDGSSSDSSSDSDSDVVAVSFSKSSKPKCANTRRGGGSGSGGPSSRTSSRKMETVKTALDRKRREKASVPRVDIDLTGGSTTGHGAALSDVMSKAAVGDGGPQVNQSSAGPSSSQNGKGRTPMVCHGNGSAIHDKRRGGMRTIGIGRTRGVEPEGVPTRGPAVLYWCRVLHGVGSSFLVLSCPNVAYVRAVLNHSIVQGARQADR